MAFNVDYGKDFYFTPGRIRNWYVEGGDGNSSDPSTDTISNFNSSGGDEDGISGKLYYDAGVFGISSNRGGNMTDNEVNAAVIGWNSRGATDAVCAGVHGLVNRGNVAGVLGEVYGYSNDASDMTENLVSGLMRGGSFIVGNAYTSSASDQSNNDVDYTFIANPRTKHGCTHENRVGINKRSPTVALDVIGEIKASANITAFSDRRAKKNIELISGSLDLVNELRGVYFEWKKPEEIAPDRYGKKLVDNPLGRQVGMIAQEVEIVIPELVEHDKENDKLSLKYPNLVAVLINAVNELTDKVNIQGKQIKELQNGKD